MQLLQLAEIDLHQLIMGLFWMLIHSLWQGLIVAAIAFILLHFFKNASSNLRYGIIGTCLLGFVLITASTLIYELIQPSDHATALTSLSSNSSIEYKPNSSSIRDSSTMNLSEIADNLANKYAYYLVLVWLICYLFYFIRFISGLLYINRLSLNTLPSSNTWTSNLIRLQDELKINKTIRVFNSERVQVPVIIGTFKPIILIPLAVANQLPIAEVEAILLHELAHIKRNDFLINLIQTVIDQLFFFNPAVRWMSSRLREEREKCCDDIVLFHSEEKEAYINALVRFQEYIFGKPAFEMALGGNKFQLFKRIRRIINKENTKSTFMDKTIFIFSILSIATLGFMSGNITKHQPLTIDKTNVTTIAKAQEVKQARFVMDTVPDKKETIEKENQKRIIKEKVDQEIREQIERSQREAELKKQEIMQQKIQLEHQMNEFKLMNRDQQIAQKMQMDQLMKMKEAQLDAEKVNLEQAQMHLQQEAFQKELQMKLESLQKEREHISLDQQKEMDEKILELKKEATLKNLQLQNEMAYLQMKKDQQLAVQMQMQQLNLQQMKMQLETNRKVSIGNNSEVEEIISSLLESKIIDKTDPLSFKLNRHELIVNGKKQNSDIFTKLKERFIHSSGDYIEYSHNGGSTSTTIHTD